MKPIASVVLVSFIAFFPVGVVAQGPPPQTRLTLQVARTMVEETMAACRAKGYKVAVLVVDGLNEPKAFLRDDGAPPNTAESAKMKATTAMLYERPSGPVQDPGVSPPPTLIPGTSPSQGALPIKVGDVQIGAIGVSGAPGGANDAECAAAGLAKVADKFK